MAGNCWPWLIITDHYLHQSPFASFLFAQSFRHRTWFKDMARYAGHLIDCDEMLEQPKSSCLPETPPMNVALMSCVAAASKQKLTLDASLVIQSSLYRYRPLRPQPQIWEGGSLFLAVGIRLWWSGTIMATLQEWNVRCKSLRLIPFLLGKFASFLFAQSFGHRTWFKMRADERWWAVAGYVNQSADNGEWCEILVC